MATPFSLLPSPYLGNKRHRFLKDPQDPQDPRGPKELKDFKGLKSLKGPKEPRKTRFSCSSAL